MGWALL